MNRVSGIALIVVASIASSAQFAQPKAGDVPAFHSAAPAKGEALPAILSPAQLAPENRKYAHAYEIAAKVPKVLYQQPCYCFCDRSVGHKSLHSCFESDHGAHCSTCMKEVFYSYQMTKAGKTP